MKKSLTPKEKILFSASIVALGLWGWFAHKVNEAERRDGLSPEQKMTLIKKDIVERKMKDMLCQAYTDGGVEVSKKYVQLTFDTDGNTNTTEVVSFPEFHDGEKETSPLKIGDQKTLKNWDKELKKAFFWYEQPVMGRWFYKKVR